VTTEYVGSGEWTISAARLEVPEREDRELARAEARARRERREAAEHTLVEYFEPVEDLARSALYAAGFHRPKREWRRRRERRVRPVECIWKAAMVRASGMSPK
jgi:hypothetical protein